MNRVAVIGPVEVRPANVGVDVVAIGCGRENVIELPEGVTITSFAVPAIETAPVIELSDSSPVFVIVVRLEIVETEIPLPAAKEIA
jgi:hypothetical protein